MPSYTSIHNDHSRDDGGGLAYIKNILKFDHLNSFLSTSIESIWLILSLGKTVIAGTVYLPTVNTTRFESLMQHLEIVYCSLFDIILTGHFNIYSVED